MLKWPKEGEEVKLTLTKEFINWLCEVVTQATSLGFPAVVHSQNESAKHACNVIYGPGDFWVAWLIVYKVYIFPYSNMISISRRTVQAE